MAPDEHPLRNISDTARWVAVYRARETERPDALFRDPFAGRLAGARGGEIAKIFAFGTKNEWSFVARTYLFDRYILDEVARGADLVLNLAAGLDSRPYRLDLPPSLQWVEVDLPELIAYKTEVLAGDTPRCTLERIALDLADVSRRRALFAQVGARARRALIVCEGLLIYLNPVQVGELATDLAATTSFQRWAIDVASPGLLKLLRKNMGSSLIDAGAPLKFAPAEGPDFFVPFGWWPIEVHSLFKTAARLHRLPFPMRLFAWLPESQGRQGSRPWTGAVLLGRGGQAG